jgi:hypothetical protein
MVGAAIVDLMGPPSLKGWKKIAIIPMAASSYPIGNEAAGCPMWIALSTDLGYHVTYLEALATLALLCTFVWATSKQFPEERVRLETKPKKQARF